MGGIEGERWVRLRVSEEGEMRVRGLSKGEIEGESDEGGMRVRGMREGEIEGESDEGEAVRKD